MNFIRGFFQADGGALSTHLYHKTAAVLMLLVPVAVVASPHPVSKPIDYALAALVPFHGHVGMNYVISDYVPKAYSTIARSSMVGVTLITFMGLMKLNTKGAGVTESIKSMWREPKKDSASTLNPLPTMFDNNEVVDDKH